MKILVVDDHALVREGLAQVLQGLDANEGVQVCQAETCAQALDVAARAEGGLDLIVLDYHLPDMSGLALLTRLVQTCPDVPVLLLSGTSEPKVAQRAIALGAAGFVTKSGRSADLLDAVRRVLQGEIVVPTSAEPGNQATAPTRPCLTKRQLDVLQHVLAGKSNHDIATSLYVSDETVKTHVGALLRLFDVRSRTQLALEADRLGYTAGPPS